MNFDWPRRALALAICVILGANAVALATVERDGDGESPSNGAVEREPAKKVKPPAAWDPRVAELADFVAEERGLRFKHPVAVRFLTEAAYLKEVGADREATLSAEEKQEIEVFTGQTRALGLLPKGVDPLDAVNTVVDEGTLAYYDPDKEEMVVRGTEVTVFVRTTLVHELTHALQDQHFDIDRTFDTSGADTVFQALVEGDAVRIEDLYIASLGRSDQEAYEQEEAETQEDIDYGGVPPAFLQLFGAPYELGAPMTTILVEAKGQDRLDALFRKPPQSDEAMINPFALLDDDKPADVPRPKLKPGEKKTDDGDFGSLTWYVVLATFIDPRTALAAVDGWKGDAYAGYKKDGNNCLRIDFRGDTPKDADEMKSALDEWQRAFASNRVTVTRTSTGTVLDACEPDVIPAPRAGAETAIVLPVARLSVVAQLLSDGAPVRLTRCFAREFVARVDLALMNEDTPAAERMYNRVGDEIRRVCT